MDLDVKLNHINELQVYISGKIKLTEDAILSLKESRDGETKSTAGDKHETGRALVQTEMDNLQVQLNKQIAQKKRIDEIPVDQMHVKVGFGSLVRFNKMNYFVSVGLGRIGNINDTKFFAISTEAPIFSELSGKMIGDNISFNGMNHKIEAIC